MNRTEHYVEAERLAALAAEMGKQMAGNAFPVAQMRGLEFTMQSMTALAQVHATLATVEYTRQKAAHTAEARRETEEERHGRG